MFNRGDIVKSAYDEYYPPDVGVECMIVGVPGDSYCSNIDGGGWRHSNPTTKVSKVSGGTYILADRMGRKRAFHHTFIEKVDNPAAFKTLMEETKEELMKMKEELGV